MNKIAVLFQAIDPPSFDGVVKPSKPGGYRDSGADIAFALKSLDKTDVTVVTPTEYPSPSSDSDWCFPDTEEGIKLALAKGANVLWANTILFSSHPITSRDIPENIRFIGQKPSLVERYDDKEFTNRFLRESKLGLRMPKSWLINRGEPLPFQEMNFPVVSKPIRGRGSHGVCLCSDANKLEEESQKLLSESSAFMIEEFLSGDEATITVMPPGTYEIEGKSVKYEKHWSLPSVMRTGHVEGVAPYNGVVAVVKNSRVITKEEQDSDETFAEVEAQCEVAAELIGAIAPIRIDVRRESKERGAHFVLFDVNMKPNMTGPGRPGRESQASLVGLAAERLMWNYPQLIENILNQSQPLSILRN
eukprot:TRINITY_DN15146_c0_g1_i2.p1 TRINITY_DN15146_c0_g1~~TRINITY_DN15146_c0_g1_i2.p1  ORF type:complete len:370 (+),score=105.49 TRINITY_DN15146_c0_g1_i2:30-1112(+)